MDGNHGGGDHSVDNLIEYFKQTHPDKLEALEEVQMRYNSDQITKSMLRAELRKLIGRTELKRALHAMMPAAEDDAAGHYSIARQSSVLDEGSVQSSRDHGRDDTRWSIQ